MLGNSPFYHKTLRKITTIFGTLFNEIYIVRTDSNNQEVERLKVPILYGPKEKYVVRSIEDPTLQRPIALKMPRMSFYITSFDYDGKRKRNKIREHVNVQSSSVLKKGYVSVPYNIIYELAIISKNQDDANQIVEQILPFFTPDFTPTYYSIPELELSEDIPIILTNVSLSDNYDESWEQRRNIVYTLTFNVKVNFYGPIKQQGVIKHAEVDTHIVGGGDEPITDEEVANTPRHFRYTVEPDPITANKDDDYGYTETFEEFNDGKKYNSVTDTDE